MSDNEVTAVEVLTELGEIIQTIATNLRANRLDRTKFQKLLLDYSHRATSDGHLIYASRQNSQALNRGLFLAYTHMEFISWLSRNNYTIPATSVKWYSLKQFASKYRLPLFSMSSQTADLQSQLKHIESTAELVHAELQAHNVKHFPPRES
ncbi:glyoxalase family protein [Penicillium nucicola]|uniref:glyoxalase family protein n=1 Tax=Penicillium nucicola TaxID=1850975 RepID=UPI002545A658|nr:glyoxalase family protein [Penicillium nucicola]KAJ5769918.1 glyoxalase family protein [Penicillium nucicola]